MNVNEVITKLRVMLSGNNEIVEEVKLAETKEKVETKMADAELVDGTKVMVEGDLEVGKTLLVEPAEGEEPLKAPEGIHETTEGLSIQIGEAGEILSIEEKSTESAEKVEEEMAKEDKEEMEKEDKKDMEMSAEDLVEAIAEMLKPQAEELKSLKEELSTLKARFNKVADEPAAEKVRNTFSQEAADAQSKAEARLERLLEIRKGK